MTAWRGIAAMLLVSLKEVVCIIDYFSRGNYWGIVGVNTNNRQSKHLPSPQYPGDQFSIRRLKFDT